jgi:hypothetical protein
MKTAAAATSNSSRESALCLNTLSRTVLKLFIIIYYADGTKGPFLQAPITIAVSVLYR